MRFQPPDDIVSVGSGDLEFELPSAVGDSVEGQNDMNTVSAPDQ